VIAVSSPDVGDEEIAEVVAALRRGEVSGTYGSAIPHFEDGFKQIIGTKHAIAVSSGTAALHLAVAAAGIRPGDEVLVPSSTNIATALAVVHNGAIPVPVDAEASTWNLDLDLVESLVTERTKAIIPVHLFGHPVDMDRLCEMAARLNLVVIEDCAESHGATVRGRMTGSFGAMGCFSFYANKIITTGEGGAVTTQDDALAERIRLLRNLGFTQPRFRHDVLGFNFRMTGMQAAIGSAQLRRFDAIVAGKRRIAATYMQGLSGMPGLRLPVEMEWARNVYWVFGVVVEDAFGITRDELAARLERAGIETRTFFCPMSAQPCLHSVKGFRATPSPVADRLWETGLYLPSSHTLPDRDVQAVIQAVRGARE
jgi:perosamine synthetase